jgi:hypothetical protein
LKDDAVPENGGFAPSMALPESASGSKQEYSIKISIMLRAPPGRELYSIRTEKYHLEFSGEPLV